MANSASILVRNNHPSGDPEPIQEDIRITRRLSETGTFMGIDLLDHIIIGEDNFVSLKEKAYV